MGPGGTENDQGIEIEGHSSYSDNNCFIKVSKITFSFINEADITLT